MADLCSDCGHAWHGLMCEYKKETLDENYRYSITEKCKCPGPFPPTIPSFDEGPRTVPTKGIW